VKNMKNKKYHTVGTIPKSNIKIVERGIMYIPNTQMHDRLLPWLDTGTSIISGGISSWGRRGCDRLVVGFTTICTISAYHH
jgi:hypothetical protein